MVGGWWKWWWVVVMVVAGSKVRCTSELVVGGLHTSIFALVLWEICMTCTIRKAGNLFPISDRMCRCSCILLNTATGSEVKTSRYCCESLFFSTSSRRHSRYRAARLHT